MFLTKQNERKIMQRIYLIFSNFKNAMPNFKKEFFNQKELLFLDEILKFENNFYVLNLDLENDFEVIEKYYSIKKLFLKFQNSYIFEEKFKKLILINLDWI